MKKVVTILLLVTTVAIGLSACGSGTVSIDDREWHMRTVMSNDIELADSDAVVFAVGELDELYPNAKVVKLTLLAKDGKITISDATNNKIYEGTYSIDGKTAKGVIYNVLIDGESGYAIAEMTKDYSGDDKPTLTINLGDYSIYFYAE